MSSLAILFEKKQGERGGRPRKYTQSDFDRMDAMKREGKTFEEIGKVFGVAGRTIRNKFYEHIGAISNKYPNGTSDKPLRAPAFNGWNFS